MVVGADSSLNYLELADENRRDFESNTQFAVGDIESLPFPDGTFDLAWCADSLVSLHRPELTLKRLRNAVKVGGWVAVMESDSLHEALLPWPPDLELAVREAEYRAYQANANRPENRYVGRNLPSLLARQD